MIRPAAAILSTAWSRRRVSPCGRLLASWVLIRPGSRYTAVTTASSSPASVSGLRDSVRGCSSREAGQHCGHCPKCGRIGRSSVPSHQKAIVVLLSTFRIAADVLEQLGEPRTAELTGTQSHSEVLDRGGLRERRAGAEAFDRAGPAALCSNPYRINVRSVVGQKDVEISLSPLASISELASEPLSRHGLVGLEQLLELVEPASPTLRVPSVDAVPQSSAQLGRDHPATLDGTEFRLRTRDKLVDQLSRLSLA